MMRLAIIFLAICLPAVFYIFIYREAKKKALERHDHVPGLFNKRLLKLFILFMLIAVSLFIIFILPSVLDAQRGQYVPASIIAGKVEKGKVLSLKAVQ